MPRAVIWRPHSDSAAAPGELRPLAPPRYAPAPAKHDFISSVSLNACFASKAATSAVIVGHFVMIQNFLLTVLLESQYCHFRLCANSVSISSS